MRKEDEDAAIVTRLRASFVPRRFPSLYLEIVEGMVERATREARARKSLIDETVSLLPEHAVAFCRATQGIGSVVDRANVEGTAAFCAAARAFRGRLMRPGVRLIITSIDDGDTPQSIDGLPGNDDDREWAACNSVAGCLPLTSSRSVTAICCCCGRVAEFNTEIHELCACGSSIFCRACRKNRLQSKHDCFQHEQKAREIAASLILKNRGFPFCYLLDESNRAVAAVAVSAFLQLCHLPTLRFAMAGMSSADVRDFIIANTLLVQQTLRHATRSLHRTASRTLLEVDVEDCTSDGRCMAAAVLCQKSAFAGRAVTLYPVDD
jgi:hypothetical protein